MQHGFDNSYMGTMAHYALETLVDELGKQYTKAAMERIEEIVNQEVEAIAAVFPNNADLMEVIKHRFLVSFAQTLKRLDDFETHSSMGPYLQEYEFHEEFPITEDISFALKGFIDRIDASGNFHCILDYKSSAKSLSEDKVFAALQLQLLTYSIVAKKQLHKDILGAYYISLKNQNIPYIAGKMKRRPVGFVETEKDDYEENILKAHRISGWTMRKDIDMLDDNGSHIIGVSMNKDGIVKARKYYRYETIYEWFISLYRTIGNRMLSGDIACSPDADACTYCAYYEFVDSKDSPVSESHLWILMIHFIGKEVLMMPTWNKQQLAAITTKEEKHPGFRFCRKWQKTTVLVARLMDLVLKDHIAIDEILAMTFTEAAANEMKKRLAKELQTAWQDSKDEAEKKIFITPAFFFK